MKDVVVIGGGFFGMYLAEYFARRGKQVLLCEKEHDFMQRASLLNQARVHNGYHYPRSVLTALRSRVSFPRFRQEFKECLDNSFEKYYMVGAVLSLVTAKQFEEFCRRIGAPCEPAPHRITRLVNPNLIEAVFSTTEDAFDAVKLKGLMKVRVDNAGVECRLNTWVKRIIPHGNHLQVEMFRARNSADVDVCFARHVFNCTYSMLNSVLLDSGIGLIDLKHEMTEICLIHVPEEISNMGITVMCGPFFSVMPYPPAGLHSFSHVRYTPHYDWTDTDGRPYVNAHEHYAQVNKRSAWRAMQLDATRYMPILSEAVYSNSMWEVKTLLPRCEVDDARPILFKPNYGLRGFHCVMGGKIDNVYDVMAEIERLRLVN